MYFEKNYLKNYHIFHNLTIVKHKIIFSKIKVYILGSSKKS